MQLDGKGLEIKGLGWQSPSDVADRVCRIGDGPDEGQANAGMEDKIIVAN